MKQYLWNMKSKYGGRKYQSLNSLCVLTGKSPQEAYLPMVLNLFVFYMVDLGVFHFILCFILSVDMYLRNFSFTWKSLERVNDIICLNSIS